tara:strand:- start:350 stop:529 length:180 start_codon:yes stop_codon:yes gene_type:complete
MKAMIIRKTESTDVFVAAGLPVSKIEPGQVLVKVAATSVNPVDWKIRKLSLSLGITTDT